MLEISETHLIAGALLLAGALLFQVLLAIVLIVTLKSSARERDRFYRELFGLMKKLEGLTTSKRELLLKQYDRLHESLAARLPSTIAATASEHLFETERRILSRLAELEPNLKKDVEGKKKMEELIRSMENLEHTIVALTADTVKKVLSEGRHEFFMDQKDTEITLAA